MQSCHWVPETDPAEEWDTDQQPHKCMFLFMDFPELRRNCVLLRRIASHFDGKFYAAFAMKSCNFFLPSCFTYCTLSKSCYQRGTNVLVKSLFTSQCWLLPWAGLFNLIEWHRSNVRKLMTTSISNMNL